MSGIFRRHASRRILIGFLALCFLWQPILLVAAEVHEVQHLLQTGHAHDTQHPESGIPVDDPHSGSSSLHVLMHLGQCCSFPVALVPATDIAARLSHAAGPVPAAQPIASPSVPAQFWRPPIFA